MHSLISHTRTHSLTGTDGHASSHYALSDSFTDVYPDTPPVACSNNTYPFKSTKCFVHIHAIV